ncbi:glycosyltransferase family protein [Variovorax guangxiensis]|uniref:Spore protein YkvP/CgeB glycosyl transferase-like domain-containing protein n=1 Tax=Variovorax guangxiensis TaxID=1775474 RepID=A0A502DTW8_9BURK|nr:glycosyltransferase [Variovorax guangxiensis]TPG24543.1 hypothetical protein EAH83_08700 [Variovorax ginsengisoli]TPG28793.1 hypothetical protein EAH82_08360 [Variovorax guangxiensis]
MSFWSQLRRRLSAKSVAAIDAIAITAPRRSLEALMDARFYLAKYPDVRDAGVDPVEHFAAAGQAEGRHPLDVTAPDATARIDLALSIDPQNASARGARILLLLASDTVEAGRQALDLHGGTVGEPRACFDLEGAFEQFASRALSRSLRFESLDDFREISPLVDDISARFPHSAALAALAGLLHFEANDLGVAERQLRSLDLTLLSVDISSLCTSVLQQLEDFKGAALPANATSAVLLLDTSFPSQVSSFRYGEFSSYLAEMDDAVMLVRPDGNLFRYGEKYSFAELTRAFNEVSSRGRPVVGPMCNLGSRQPQVAYCVFLNLAHLFFSQIGLPYARNLVFTLYPGGGFAPGNAVSDTKLAKVFANPCLSKVVTTQNLTRDYLIDKGYCKGEDILHVFGGIVPAAYAADPLWTPMPLDGTLNVCFVAQRYSPLGAEKGYDIFAQIVRLLSSSSGIHFHVVGGFDRDVVDLGGAKNVTFYGSRPASFFPEFYKRMHVVVSPNIRMFDLDPKVPATFDGFPTTAVVEAGLQGAAMLATDFLGMNQRLDGSRIFTSKELILIDREPARIAEILRGFMKDPDALQALRVSGRLALLREFGFERQMRPRINLLNSYLRN